MNASHSFPAMLCLFDGDDARQASCFAGDDWAWIDRTDHGRCRYVSAAMDLDEPDSGFMQVTAAVVVVRPERIDDAFGARLRLWLSALEDQDIAVDLVTTDAPVTMYSWLSAHVPRMVGCLQPHGAVNPELPSWWRSHAEHHLANPQGHTTVERDHSTGAFSAEMIRSYLARRNGR